jgi:ribonuclease P protein component
VDDFFTVLYRPNGLMRPRLGLAIAKKKVRRAVARNRLKRIIRESFRVAERQLNSFDIVIMARQKAGSALNKELFASLDHHWQLMHKPMNKPEHH